MPNIVRSIALTTHGVICDALSELARRRAEVRRRCPGLPRDLGRCGARCETTARGLRCAGRGEQAGLAIDRRALHARQAASPGTASVGRSPSAARIARIHSGSAACAPSPSAPSFVRRIVEADPHGAERAAGEADEPGVGVVVRRAGLAGGGATERRARPPRCRARRRRAIMSCELERDRARRAAGRRRRRRARPDRRRRSRRTRSKRRAGIEPRDPRGPRHRTARRRRAGPAPRTAARSPSRARAMIANARASSIGFTHDAPSAIGRTLGERAS